MMKEKKNWTYGFTLVETLAAVAVLVILLGVSAVAVAHYRKYMKITELDHAAREIYMAAENRAVLLGNRMRLGGLVEEEGRKVTIPRLPSDDLQEENDEEKAAAYYITRLEDEEVLRTLLPEGSIDPTLYEGDFYLVYEPVSGSVTDVFYAETPIHMLGDEEFQTFYDRWSQASREERMKTNPMLGYYNGGMAEGGKYGVLPTPGVAVLFRNEEKLTVEVIFAIPEELQGETVEKTVTLEYEGTKLALFAGDTLAPEYQSRLIAQNQNNGRETYTWVLDSLEAGESGDYPERFARLFDGIFGAPAGFGGTVTVTAELSSPEGKFTEVSDSDEDNSLFAGVDAEGTAQIRYLRHLQNLDTGFSKAAGTKKAVQTADLFCQDNEVYPEYELIPVENPELTSYDGGGCEIQGLQVTPESVSGNPAAGLAEKSAAGLFAGTEVEHKFLFTGVRLVNASVECVDQGGSKLFPAGALVGKVMGDAEFRDCRVYWEPEEGEQDLQSLLGSEKDGYDYRIRGNCAGGLAGETLGTVTVEGCLAASTIRGASAAGGLFGLSHGDTEIRNSFADCYLAGARAAGLIGEMSGSLMLVNSYAAGFADMRESKTAAGLCTGSSAKVTTQNVYTAMRYPERKDQAIYELTQTQEVPNNDIFENTYYLGTAAGSSSGNLNGKAVSYEELTSEAFADRLNQGAAGAVFAWKSAGNSNPYNLQEHLNLTVYSFPGLKVLPHYGDWGAQFKEPSLVYYEQYENEVFGFSGGNARYLVGELSDDQPVYSDGYAVAALVQDLEDQLTAEGAVSIVYRYFDGAGSGQLVEKTATYTKGEPAGDGQFPLIRTEWENAEGNRAEYYLAFLPEELVTGAPVGKDFFQYLRFELKLTDTDENPGGEYFYNPHFAETVVPYVPEEGGISGPWTPDTAAAYGAELLERYYYTVSIRTPRHLYDLSKYPEYFHNDRHSYTFRQGLDLDYAFYTGHHLTSADDFLNQTPIGSYDMPFQGIYDGGCHRIRGVAFQIPDSNSRSYAGLFGYSAGVLKNMVYEMDADREISVSMGRSAQNRYLGGLAGGNGGTIQNCAVSGVRLTGHIYDASIYIGGLTGQNQGMIQECAAEVASLAANGSNYGHAYVGGLVGMNTRDREIRTSYAVGRVTAGVDSTSDAKICGFVGRNEGSIESSYAAVDLRSSGRNVEVNGFCGVAAGQQRNTYYLNEGNFTYRDSSYTAAYEKKRAVPVTHAELSASSSCVPGMSMGASAQGEGSGTYPYPAAVKGADGSPVHYGQWPNPMDLGEMGVYYWEKLESDSGSAYHVSLLAVDPVEQQVSRRSTLSDAHDDGGVVTDYGYGYYSREGLNISIAAEALYNSEPGAPGKLFTADVVSEQETDEALAGMMRGFTFHSYRGFRSDTGGLHPGGKDQKNGILTLNQGGTSGLQVSFYINPLFGDAMSAFRIPGGWTLADPVLSVVPGIQEENPYGVRSIEQLENINWNSENRNTETVVELNRNIGDFPYLSSSDETGKYYWKQTHDLKGREGAIYTPIAEYYDSTGGNQGNLYGWFGGAFDGADYIIEDVNIQGQKSSCAGLFGIVYNGTLKNIILYSSDGKGTVTSGHYENSDYTSRWYAIGALAGVAASHIGNAVENCAVAGYTINGNIYTYTDGGNNNWGGSGIGGLLGISNMPLKNCSAVTTVRFPVTAKDNDNTRVGGLVGTCQDSITNCYAGGSIQVDQDAKGETGESMGIYIGGIVGGSYMKPLQVSGGQLIGIVQSKDDPGRTNNALSNCYSYVRLPKAVDKEDTVYRDRKIKSLYALGGVGEINANPQEDLSLLGAYKANHGTCTITNCYYLEEEVLGALGGTITGITTSSGKTTGTKTDLGAGGVKGLTYRQLAGSESLDNGQEIYASLNEGGSGPFAPVTSTTDDGYSVAGKYSYSSAARLKGMNYPFPTILTREGGRYHVHYGDWPTNGIEREEGGAPVFLDLFALPEYSETLSLTNGVEAGGRWEVESEAAEIAGAKIEEVPGTGEGRLTIYAEDTGSTVLTVFYRTQDTEYTFSFTVHVTAEMDLRPAEVTLFPNDTVTVPLAVYSRKKGLDQSEEGEEIQDGRLEITSVSSGGSLAVRLPTADELLTDETARIILTGGADVPDEAVMVNVGYTCIYKEREYTGNSAVQVRVIAPPELVSYTGTDGKKGYKITFEPEDTEILEVKVTSQDPSASGPAASAETKQNVIILTDVSTNISEICLEISLTMDGCRHTLAMTAAIPAGASEIPAGVNGPAGAAGSEVTEEAEEPEGTQSPEEPGDAEAPEGTGNPENPGEAENPEAPEGTQSPEGTGNPENPGEAESPETPEESENPEASEGAGNPENPGEAESPGAPEESENPEVPEGTQSPEGTGNPGEAENPGALEGSQSPGEAGNLENPGAPEEIRNPKALGVAESPKISREEPPEESGEAESQGLP